ncbi:MAG TPA: glucose-1-phosphate adenylyltransferase subunit GlgD [Clostridia bacterium]|nr:glucose-1-phosphate adenylyltransferase subunit GlgD [Clostridia bacterium]
MRSNNVLGIIFSNAYDDVLPEITNLRTMGSVPFGGRYRLIDFALSNLVNCGISKVGVITKSNYQSLMDHIGTGKPWDLSRKIEGLYLLPPFSSIDAAGMYANRIQALHGRLSFLNRSNEEYVVLCDCNVVCNLDLSKILSFHDKTGADITVAYKHGDSPKIDDTLTFDVDDNFRIKSAAMNIPTAKDVDYSLNIYVMRKSLLERLITEAISLNNTDFERDLIQKNTKSLKIFGYKVAGFAKIIDSLQSYFDINMQLLKKENRRELFKPEHPVYTKVRDDMPAIYGLGSKVGNSLIADGCIINGTVENCILFRGVRIAKNAVVKNSIIMQGSYISECAIIENVIVDKSCVITPNKTLCGSPNFPIYVGKGIVI